MKIHFKDLTNEQFLKHYWQKQPLLIKGAFKQFVDPIEADELAGLAMEDFIESRIVSKSNTAWDVKHGPFEDFSEFGESDWTLLVQAVNHWFKGVDDLIEPFRFIPNWRIDDVMVSFSTPGGGVGPHLDQYDVFIIQGSGKRRWRVGAPDASLEQLLPHEDLKQVSEFTSIIDEITEPGDLLYIPPNHPHDGIAIDNSINYSIGFLAPSSQELLSGLADYNLDNNLNAERIDDSLRQATDTPEQLSSVDLDLLTNTLKKSLSDPDVISDFLGKYLTTVHHTLNLLIPVEPLTIDFIKEILSDGEQLNPVLGLKCILHSSQHNSDSLDNKNNRLFVNGEVFEVANESILFAKLLASKQTLSINELKTHLNCLKNQQLLTNVINKGLWSFE
ncbi:cupin domain-containing protein [Thalassomonas sp. M1454]|uniref:cupin domain-containing protein n=1 Tax=Thalassomonas sp. M1454 TaxID=2594477 RepID=UPI00118032DC|nr:cupin domain-containing protein [Thalassomonas sp. M1454]TRX56916.1 cupin domain-containing protein [Thalassomonas sp. M1454]